MCLLERNRTHGQCALFSIRQISEAQVVVPCTFAISSESVGSVWVPGCFLVTMAFEQIAPRSLVMTGLTGGVEHLNGAYDILEGTRSGSTPVWQQQTVHIYLFGSPSRWYIGRVPGSAKSWYFSETAQRAALTDPSLVRTWYAMDEWVLGRRTVAEELVLVKVPACIVGCPSPSSLLRDESSDRLSVPQGARCPGEVSDGVLGCHVGGKSDGELLPSVEKRPEMKRDAVETCGAGPISRVAPIEPDGLPAAADRECRTMSGLHAMDLVELCGDMPVCFLPLLVQGKYQDPAKPMHLRQRGTWTATTFASKVAAVWGVDPEKVVPMYEVTYRRLVAAHPEFFGVPRSQADMQLCSLTDLATALSGDVPEYVYTKKIGAIIQGARPAEWQAFWETVAHDRRHLPLRLIARGIMAGPRFLAKADASRHGNEIVVAAACRMLVAVGLGKMEIKKVAGRPSWFFWRDVVARGPEALESAAGRAALEALGIGCDIDFAGLVASPVTPVGNRSQRPTWVGEMVDSFECESPLSELVVSLLGTVRCGTGAKSVGRIPVPSVASARHAPTHGKRSVELSVGAGTEPEVPPKRRPHLPRGVAKKVARQQSAETRDVVDMEEPASAAKTVAAAGGAGDVSQLAAACPQALGSRRSAGGSCAQVLGHDPLVAGGTGEDHQFAQPVVRYAAVAAKAPASFDHSPNCVPAAEDPGSLSDMLDGPPPRSATPGRVLSVQAEDAAAELSDEQGKPPVAIAAALQARLDRLMCTGVGGSLAASCNAGTGTASLVELGLPQSTSMRGLSCLSDSGGGSPSSISSGS